MGLDWDKLRVFHAAAKAGSFTHAADALNLSQSAISRQVSALEEEVGVALFMRHARGLKLTEQGEMLYNTANDVLVKLENARIQLAETKDHPAGTLRVTTTAGFGSGWLTDRIPEFIEAYPDINLQLLLSNEELDLSTREADCAIRLSQPVQPDLIQRRLFTVHFHVYAAPSYLNRHGMPQTLADVAGHRLITFGAPVPAYLRDVNWLQIAVSELAIGEPLKLLQINDLRSIRRACEAGAGIAALPAYLVPDGSPLVRLLPGVEMPSFDTYFCYPEAIKNAAKLKAFRDFLLSKAKNWQF
ncbi:MAG: LysR family transcriptional regulator [Rhizobiaceae bacterium]|jgi:DNA-binding transcriptional LysR family regulator|nr:LysR family transcriptional regulator [Rhizobiaceae bacterium]